MKKSLFLLTVLLFTATWGNLQAQDLTKELDWYNYDDTADRGSSVCRFKLSEENVNGKTVVMAVMTGTVTTQFKYGYAGMGAKPNPEILKLLRGAKGLKFRVIGDGSTYRFKAETSDVRDYDYFGQTFATEPGKEVEITILFETLQQEGWGQRLTFDPGRIGQISWQTVGQPHDSVTLKVYDIRIIK